MVTASHNPPADNGYKVYLGRRPLLAIEPDAATARAGAGAQIVPPADALIAERIAEVPSVASVPRAESGWELLDSSIVDSYLESIEALGVRASVDLRIVLTSLHGVGAGVAEAALALTGFSDVHPVSSQQAPDPDFPTVTFPNPEEAGALDESYALAREIDADLIIANDPDADRFSAAIPDATAPTGFRRDRRRGGTPPRRGHRRPPGGRSTGFHPARAGVADDPRLREFDRLLPRTRGDRTGSRVRRRADAHRLQVDLPRAGARLRLRGGARLLRRSECRP